MRGGREGGVPDPALEEGGAGEGGYLIEPWTGDGVPVSVKGKIFDTRFGLIHVQKRKKIFLSREPPPPPPSKGKYF